MHRSETVLPVELPDWVVLVNARGEELLIDLKRGQITENQFYEKLARLLQQHLRLYVKLRYLAGWEDADDASQEVMLRMYRYFRRHEYRLKIPLWAFTTVVTTNMAIDRFRRNQHRIHEVPPPSERSDWDRLSLDAQAQGGNDFINRLMLSEALETLTPRDRQMLAMRFAGGYSIEKIAQKLKLNRNTVARRIDAAVHSIKDSWEGETNDRTKIPKVVGGR